MVFPNAIGLFHQHNSTVHSQLGIGLANVMKSSRRCPDLQIPLISIQLSIYGKNHNKSNPQWLHNSLCLGAINQKVPSEFKPWVEAALQDMDDQQQVVIIFWLFGVKCTYVVRGPNKMYSRCRCRVAMPNKVASECILLMY